MGKTSYRGQGPRSRGQAITRGSGGASQTGGPQHQANPVHCPNTGCPKNDSNVRRLKDNDCHPSDNNRRPRYNDRRPNDNDHRPNNKDGRQYSDGRNPVHVRTDAEHRWPNPRIRSWTSSTCPTSRTRPPMQQQISATTRPDPKSQTQADAIRCVDLQWDLYHLRSKLWSSSS